MCVRGKGEGGTGGEAEGGEGWVGRVGAQGVARLGVVAGRWGGGVEG